MSIRVQQEKDGILIFQYTQLLDGRREYRTPENRTRTVKPGENPPWCVVLDGEDTKALASQLSDYITDGIPELGYLQGKLEVMESYLADMRSIAIPESLQ